MPLEQRTTFAAGSVVERQDTSGQQFC